MWIIPKFEIQSGDVNETNIFDYVCIYQQLKDYSVILGNTMTNRNYKKSNLRIVVWPNKLKGFINQEIL